MLRQELPSLHRDPWCQGWKSMMEKPQPSAHSPGNQAEKQCTFQMLRRDKDQNKPLLSIGHNAFYFLGQSVRDLPKRQVQLWATGP